MKKKLLLGMTVLFMIISVIFVACPSDSGGGSASSDDDDDEEYFGPNAPVVNPDVPQGEAILQGNDVTLTVTVPNVTPEEEALLVYQWFWNTVESTRGGNEILGANKKDYDPPTDVVGILYYYVRVTFPDGTELFSKPQMVEVKPKEEGKIYAQQPKIDFEEKTYAYLFGTDPTDTEALPPLVARAYFLPGDGAGILKIQWYKTTTGDKEGAVAVGEPEESLSAGMELLSALVPDISVAGSTIYYFVEVTNTIPEGENVLTTEETKTSGFATVYVVENALPPRITTEPVEKFYTNKNDATLNMVALKVVAALPTEASQKEGVLSYQWYMIDAKDENKTETLIEGATLASYMPEPPTYNVATNKSMYSYYCVVTNTLPKYGDFDRVNTAQTKTVSVGIGIAEVTLSGITVTSTKVYDGTTNIAYNDTNKKLTGLNSLDTTTGVTVLSVKYQSKNVGTNIPIVLDCTLTGPDKDEYFLRTPTLTANITRATGADVATYPTDKLVTSFSITVNPVTFAASATELQKAEQTIQYGYRTAMATSYTWLSAGVEKITGLTANTDYYIAARTTQTTNFSAGDTKFYPLSITTALGSPVSGPVNVADVSITDTSFTINVEPTVTQFSITAQVVEYHVNTSGTITQAMFVANPTTYVWTANTTYTGLEGGTAYYIYVRSKRNDEFDAGAPQVSGVVKTKDCVITFVFNTSEYSKTLEPVEVPKGTTFDITIFNNVGNGLDFDFVYTDAARTIPFDVNAPINKSVTLYPRWVDPAVKTANRATSKTHQMEWINGGVHPRGTRIVQSGFWMAKYEMTQEKYNAIMNANPSAFKSAVSGETNTPNTLPVEQVSWYEAIVFCNKLTMFEDSLQTDPAKKMGAAYSIRVNNVDETDPAKWGAIPTSQNATWDAVKIVAGSKGYRLPTEFQWECAAYGNTTAIYDAGWVSYNAMGYNNTNSPFINYTTASPSISTTFTSNRTSFTAYNISGNKTHKVGLKPSTGATSSSLAGTPETNGNGKGLFDMLGNVAEWCWDWYSAGIPLQAIDYAGPATGTTQSGYSTPLRTFKGGSWSNMAVSATYNVSVKRTVYSSSLYSKNHFDRVTAVTGTGSTSNPYVYLDSSYNWPYTVCPTFVDVWQFCEYTYPRWYGTYYDGTVTNGGVQKATSTVTPGLATTAYRIWTYIESVESITGTWQLRNMILYTGRIYNMTYLACDADPKYSIPYLFTYTPYNHWSKYNVIGFRIMRPWNEVTDGVH